MENFRLFMGCLGNGITVCNAAVEEHGDYKYIAHISNGGNIRLYVEESYIPADAMEKIKQAAKETGVKYHAYFEALPEIEQYGICLNYMGIRELLTASKDVRPLEEKLPDMRKRFYAII